MSISLAETQTIGFISDLIYTFLPGQPHPYANQKISYKGIANDLNLSEYWPGGSKLPAINYLLSKTLEVRRGQFCNLMIQIVNRGIIYRKSKNNPITREEIVALNEYIRQIGFKIPELWDSAFFNSLLSTSGKNVKQSVKNEIEDNNEKAPDFKKLLNKFLDFENIEAHERGYAFEEFLRELFDAYGLRPRSSFRLVGEQIDGSLELDSNTYLIEAKWQKLLIGNKELLSFYGKVDGKASWSRGIYISYTGFSPDGLEAFGKGRATNIITITGQDIYFILDGGISLVDCIRKKARWAAETGEIHKSAYELLVVGH